ncbi:MAG: QueT transporter family protein [Lachnospiraceae bacterium]|nr:QueT transporter family protein [Lachnospiraceae bacterium]MBQ9562000.1 QueT transporter family protein [Lachnospiraceae bacterium]MBR0153761.1 QueT transporter family protein [Lachnospiraceae bacterium]
MKKTFTTRFIAQAGIIAAIYVALVLLFAPISFNVIQFRIAEALAILPYFTPAGIPGVTIGCLIGNLIGMGEPLDIIFGTLATLIGAFGSYALRRNKWLVPIPPILSNTIIIPWVLRFAYGVPDAIPYLMLTVGIGEVLAIYVLGMILLLTLERLPKKYFR